MQLHPFLKIYWMMLLLHRNNNQKQFRDEAGPDYLEVNEFEE